MAAKDAGQRKPSFLGRVLRTVARALLLAFVLGLAVGTWLRCEIERSAPRTLPYLGDRTSGPSAPDTTREAGLTNPPERSARAA